MSNGSTTAYFVVGAHYEVANGVVTKYYFAGAQRIALRTNGTLNYLLGDHLGSTSLTTDANGVVISELRYKAWGETRYASGIIPTQYQYTGQYSYAADFGLMFYNARWYDSSLSRFAQADTVVPGGMQGLDRYAYANNSPVRYIDPSGHDVQCTLDDGCWETNNDGSVGSSGDSPTYIDRSQLTKVDNDSAYSGEQLYQLYIEAWYEKSGWWWDVYGGDNQFSIWEFLDILWSYELGGIGYDDALVQGSMDALSAKIAALGGNTSAAGQLNFLAAWSSSAGRRLNKKFYPNYVDPRDGTYKCNGEICSIGQIIDKPQNILSGISQRFYPTQMDINKPFEIAEETSLMDYALSVSSLIRAGYYWQKSGDNMFTVLTYCQFQYLKTGVVVSSTCDMTIHAP